MLPTVIGDESFFLFDSSLATSCRVPRLDDHYPPAGLLSAGPFRSFPILPFLLHSSIFPPPPLFFFVLFFAYYLVARFSLLVAATWHGSI